MKKTVLIVDNFENTRFVVDFTLRNKGYDILQAENGVDALRFFDGRRIDLVVTDLNMPKMNGIDLIKQIRTLTIYAGVPILILTTDRDRTKMDEARKALVTGWIQKPFKIDKFVETVERCLSLS